MPVFTMTTNGGRHPSYSSSQSSRYGAASGAASPPSKVLLDGYKNPMESANGERSRFDTVRQQHTPGHNCTLIDHTQFNKPRLRSSALLNVDDPVAMHLLMETAIGDSQGYDIISFEEVDELKREQSFLETRIEATRRKLTLESKLRDAAQSLNRLYSTKGVDGSVASSPGSVKKHRRSIMGSRGSSSELLSKTDDELSASAKKCEELAQELWRLEKRGQEIQRRLLQHTAGILQMTHRRVQKKGQSEGVSSLVPEVVGMYPVDFGGYPSIDGVDDFDQRSFYRSLDVSNDLTGGHDPSGNSRADIHSRTTSLGPLPSSDTDFVQQTRAIQATETKLEDLNQRLKSIIAKSTLDRDHSHSTVPKRQTNGDVQQPGASLQAQLDDLERGLQVIDSHRRRALSNAESSSFMTEGKLEALNARLYGLIQRTAPDQSRTNSPPPELDRKSAEAQIDYLEDGLDTVGRHMQGLINAMHAFPSRSIEDQEKIEQTETVLESLWNIVAIGDSGSEQRGQQVNNDRGLFLDEGSVSGGGFSLQSLPAKIQALHTRATGLHEQKDILTRQIQQQRELNAKTDAQKDAQVLQLTEDLQRNQTILDAAQHEMEGLKDGLASVTTDLSAARQEAFRMEQQGSMTEANALKAERESRKELEERMSIELRLKQEKISRLEIKHDEIRDDATTARAEMQGLEAKIQELTERLDEMLRSKEAVEEVADNLREKVDQKTRDAGMVQAEMNRLEGEVVRLQTEVTVARAELDGAYGTRAQRAAEVAANPALQKELDELVERNTSLLREIAFLKERREEKSGSVELQSRIETLRSELTETIAEYEGLIKSNIEFEKEREQLESVIDGLRDRCEALETQLSDEKVKWLGMKMPGASGRDGGPSETTSTMVLKNEFKKMMRDTRAENTRALRVRETSYVWQSLHANICKQAEQDERRKLENMVRSLRRDQIPSKSGLSQSMTTH